MGTTGYEKQDIAAISDGMRYLIRYVCSANEQAYNELDHPLYKDFVNNATGALAKIKLDEITTENTFRMEVHNEVSEGGRIWYDRAVNSKLTLSDFMGITEVEPGEGIAVLENVDSVNWFKYMFRMDYEEQGFSKAEVKEILKGYADNGEFFHKGYHPVKGFISGLLDVTIIKPAIEAVIGIDLITQEELTAFERGMQGVDALIGIVTLGQGAAAARTAEEGIFKTVFKTWATDAISDTAAYTVGSICDENGVPICISLALSGLTGCTVSKKTGRYLLTDEVSGAVTEYTAEEVQSLLKRTGIAEVTGEGADLLEELAKNSERIIDSVKREPEVLETVVKKGGALGNAVAGKKALTEGVIAKTIGNIDGLTDAAKTGGKSIDATQQAVKGIKTADVTDTIKKIEVPKKKNVIKEVLYGHEDWREVWTEEERRYYEVLKKGSQAGLTPAELLGIQKVDEQLILNRIDYDEVLALRKGASGGGKEVLEEAVESVGDVAKAETLTSRPTWRQSELEAATDFPDYGTQKSFINGEVVPYGTKGSVRPDYYKDGFSVDIKNYNVESVSGRNNLVRNIEKQYYQRIENLPEGTKQEVMIDIRGQNISDATLNELYDNIMQRTNNSVEILFKMD